MKQDVAIVIVNWNGYDNTNLCLQSIEKLKKKDATCHVIVVDNASSDGSINKLTKKYPSVVVLAQDTNRGFAEGNNQGIDYALEHGAEYVWLLNNDTIVDKRALVILDSVRNGKAGIAGSKIYFAQGFEYHKDRYTKKEQGSVLWYAGGMIDWENMYASHRGVDEVDHGQYDDPMSTDFVTGCSMMVHRDVFKRIGMLDERYYLYLEDVDFCLRAKRAGFGVVYEPSSVVWHRNASSSGGAGSSLHDYYLMRNRFLLGFSYARVRTKFALFRQAVSLLFSDNKRYRQAAKDALLGRYGKQYAPIIAKT